MQPELKAELRAVLESQIAGLEQQASGQQLRSEAVELDQAKVGRLSRMDALQQQAMQDATQSRVLQQLQRLRHALQRMADEDYGFCRECDEAIAPGRLKIDPAVTLCIKCAAQEPDRGY
ncbi:MAG: molecular chaperone DnaK [Gammaproteobacteria bacterium HGW-Gammaproteobacteria-11]|nr:MAG: molecular chaperone DnaK [Gammaproteobacteria bacterium HGW-Gammaproteobacteria-11]